jgi:hypothetical protein
LPNARFAETFPFLYENVFGVSPEKIVYAAYALTIIVKDAITKKPVVGATVTANTTAKATDETGSAIFDVLPLGTYTVEIRHPSYLSKKFSVTVTEEGEAREVTLIPLWTIGASIVGAGAVVTLVVTKALKWW